jgi:hypothetical protein
MYSKWSPTQPDQGANRLETLLGFFLQSSEMEPPFPPPHPQASVSPPPLVPGEGHTRMVGRGGGGAPIRTRAAAEHNLHGDWIKFKWTTMDRSSTSYLLATLARDMATTVAVACSSKEEEEVGTNPCE